MGLFLQPRDIALFKRFSELLVLQWMNVLIMLIKLNALNIKVNIYGEAKGGKREYYKGILMPGLIDHNPQLFDFTLAMKYKNTAKYRFLESTLKSHNVYPLIGDIIVWRDLFWLITNVTGEQLLGNSTELEWSKTCLTTIVSNSKVKQLLELKR